MEKPIFGSNLQRLRKEKGLTQAQLGELVGLSRRMIIHYEKYSTHPPVEKVAVIARALGTSVEALLKVESLPVKISKPDLRFAKKIEKAKHLPSEDKKILETMITSFLKKHDKQAA